MLKHEQTSKRVISRNGGSLGLKSTFLSLSERPFDNPAPQWSIVWPPVFRSVVLLWVTKDPIF